MFEAGGAEPEIEADARTILVANKADLARHPSGLAISCVTGAGFPVLLTVLAEHVRSLTGIGEAPLLTRARHREAVTEAEIALVRFVSGAAEGSELALLAEDLRLAARAIGRLTGAIGVEDVLDRIFSTFCIGK